MADNNQSHPSSRQNESQDFFRQLDIQLLIHELKGPLSVIENNNRMLLELSHRYGRLNEFQERALRRSLRCTAKLSNIIQSILEVGSSQAGNLNLSRFYIVHFATEIIVGLLETEISKTIGELQGGECDIDHRYEYLSANGIFLDISPEVKGLVLHQDEAKFGHILTNLVRNALQHKKSRVIVHMALKKQNLEICINDDGNGIDPEDQHKLFKCYTQIKKPCHRQVRAKGNGLGLAISRILARRLGGDITIDTLYRSGSSFVLQLPLECE
jgi:two-component system OmpR family sensor kinase